MAIRTSAELFSSLKTIMGDDLSDTSLSFLEDMKDTFAELEKEPEVDKEDWKAKYQELDTTWKQKYKETFFSGVKETGGTDDTLGTKTPSVTEPETTTIDSLFK